MARTKNPAPALDSTADGTAPGLAPETASSPAAALLAALSAEPGGATAATLAGPLGISTGAARKELAAHEKAGNAIRVKAARPGLPDTWKPAAPRDEATLAEGSASAEDEQPESGTGQDSDPAVTADAAENIQAVVQAADAARQALEAGDITAVLNALDAVREQAAGGNRAPQGASGRRGTGTRPGALRALVEDDLRQFPMRPPHRTRSARR